MRIYLLAAAVLSLSACTTSRNITQQAHHESAASEPITEQYAAPAPLRLSPVAKAKLSAKRRPGALPIVASPDGGDRPLDSLVQAENSPVRRRGLLGIFGRKPASAQPVTAHRAVLRKCKGCTFNVVAGNQTVAEKKATVAAGAGAVASHVEKNAGPSIVGSDSSTQNALAGPGNIQATNGNNNAPQLTAPVQQAADWRAVLAKPAAQVVAVALVVALVGGLLLWRKKKAVENLV